MKRSRLFALVALLAVIAAQLGVASPPAGAAASEIYGTVSDDTTVSAPISGAEIVAVRASDSRRIGSATTDDAGKYRVSVPDGTYDLEIVPPLDSEFTPKRLASRAVQGRTNIDMHLMLDTNRLVATVTKECKEGGVVITLRNNGTGPAVFRISQDAISVDEVNVLSGSESRIVRTLAEDEGATFKVEAEGRTITSSFVRFDCAEPPPAPAEPSATIDWTCAAAVRVTLRNPTSAPVTFEIAKNGVAHAEVVPAGGTTVLPYALVEDETASFVVRVGSTALAQRSVDHNCELVNIIGQLRDERGQVLSAQTVTFRSTSTPSDGTGRFSLWVQPGASVLRIEGGSSKHAGAFLPLAVSYSAPLVANTDIDLGAVELPAASIAVTVTDAENDQVQNASFTLTCDSSKSAPFSSGLLPGGTASMSNVAAVGLGGGRYEVIVVPAAGVRFDVRGTGSGRRSDIVDATALAPSLEVQLLPLAKLSGVVRSDDGAAVGGQRVSLTDPCATVSSTSAADDGSYSVEGYPGSFGLSVDASAPAVSGAARYVVSSFELSGTRNLDLTLDTVTRRFEVIDALGDPVPNVLTALRPSLATTPGSVELFPGVVARTFVDAIAASTGNQGEPAAITVPVGETLPISFTPPSWLYLNATNFSLDSRRDGANVVLVESTDVIDPTIVGNVLGDKSPFDWFNTDVTVEFTCDDQQTEIHFCTPGVTLESEGAGQLVTGKAVDRGANEAVADVIVNIDKTKPSVIASGDIDGAWRRSATVSIACDDQLSTLQTCAGETTTGSLDDVVVHDEVVVNVTIEGANQPIPATATDRAANSESKPVTVNIDRSQPTIEAVVPLEPISGWYKSPVPVSFDCRDALSGIKSCTAPAVLGHGANQSRAGQAVDNVDFTRSAVVGDIDVDLNAPTITVRPEPIDGWTSGAIRVEFECADDLSGVARCPDAFDLTGDGEHTRVVEAEDVAGNVRSLTLIYRIDSEKPTISAEYPTKPVSGWYSAGFDVTFRCFDRLSGVASCSPPQALRHGADQFASGRAVDHAGNQADLLIEDLDVDLVKPTIEASPAPGASWLPRGTVVTFSCSDDLSLVESCPDPETLGDGTHSLTRRARDVAGNFEERTFAYAVDSGAPELSVTYPPKPASGWYAQNVTVTVACADVVSGIAECTGGGDLGEGADQVVNARALDRAGNVSAESVADFDVDLTAPVIVPSPAPGAVRPGTLVTFSCNDPLSGAAACPDSVDVSGPDGPTVLTVSARDVAGNEVAKSFTYIIDSTPPRSSFSSGPPVASRVGSMGVRGASTDDGSRVASVSVTFTPGAGAVGTASTRTVACSGSSATCSWNVAPPVGALGQYGVSVVAVDRLGYTSEPLSTTVVVI